MTQGYGPHQGQQGQWGAEGQGGQNPPPAPQPQQQPQWGSPEQAPPAQPQWGQPSPQSASQFGSPTASPSQPQWGQASPAGAPGAYPGAVGSSGLGNGPEVGTGDGVNWRRVKLIGLILLAGTALVLLLRLGINLATFIGADDIAASNSGGDVGVVGMGSGLVSLVLYILNFLVGFILFVLGVVAAVMGRGRARVGGIVVAAAIPVSVILYWVLNIVMAVVLMATGAADDQTGAITGTGYRITAGTNFLHVLVIVAMLGLGSFFVHSTATKKLSA